MVQDALKFLLRKTGSLFLQRRFVARHKIIPKGMKVALLLAVLIYLPGYSKLRALKDVEAELKGQILKAEETRRHFLAEQEALAHDPLYAEKIAREEMRFAGEREIIYKVE